MEQPYSFHSACLSVRTFCQNDDLFRWISDGDHVGFFNGTATNSTVSMDGFKASTGNHAF